MTFTMGVTIVNNTENSNNANIYWAPTTRHCAKDLKPSIPLDPDNTRLRYLPSFPHFTDAETDMESS